MTGSRLMHWILGCLVAAIAVAGCTGDTSTGGSTGGLNLNLQLAPGVEIDEVDWTITGGDMDPMNGTIDTSAPGATASVEVYGLPPGSGYTVELAATSNDGQITCGGSADFSVEVGVSTDVMVMLNCKRPERLGGVRVNGKFNICAELAKVVVSPLQTSVGNSINLSAIGVDAEGDPITYVWSATGGMIGDPNATQTTFTCGEVGDQMITITVSDDSFEYCMADWSVLVTCVPGTNLCEGVDCDDQNECTTDQCNPATGECSNDAVEDGTACDGGAGACSAGECVPADLCEGVDCNDDNECTTDACDPADGSCNNNAVEDGTACNGGAGMCVSGSCVTDLCEGVTCDDTGNECTAATCNMQTGQCEVANVPDGTSCNGGAGACSAGECVDNNLCDGVDCTSSSQCVADGTCDPADGSCIAGSNEPADTACSENGGTVCDGQGNCVECTSAGQCPDDGNACTAATCDGGVCGQSNLADGTSCDFGGAPGTCMSGTCEDAMLCQGVDCSDGNECTDDVCDPADGSCSNPAVADGTSCDGGAGECLSGTCEAIDLCAGVDCSDGNECTDDICNPADGSCSNPAVADGTACSVGECVSGTCQSVAVDPDPQSKVITVGCRNNITADISILPYQLDVDPGPIAAGQSVDVLYGGVAEFAVAFLDAAQSAVPGGVTKAALVALTATTQVRSGGTFPNVVLGPDAALPYVCRYGGNTCDPANDLASVPGSRANTDCVPTGNFNPCERVVNVPISSDCAAGGLCDTLGKLATQCALNGFCVTGGLPLDLEPQSSTGTAGASGDILFGWYDSPTVCPPTPGSLCSLPAAVFTAPVGPIGLRVNASGLSVALECNQAADDMADGAATQPDSALIPFAIP